jgi:hypothetical protein
MDINYNWFRLPKKDTRKQVNILWNQLPPDRPLASNLLVVGGHVDFRALWYLS